MRRKLKAHRMKPVMVAPSAMPPRSIAVPVRPTRAVSTIAGQHGGEIGDDRRQGDREDPAMHRLARQIRERPRARHGGLMTAHGPGLVPRLLPAAPV